MNREGLSHVLISLIEEEIATYSFGGGLWSRFQGLPSGVFLDPYVKVGLEVLPLRVMVGKVLPRN